MRLDGTRVRMFDTVEYEDSAGCTHEGVVQAVDGDHGLTVALGGVERYLPAEALHEADAERRLRVAPAAGRVGEGEVER